jgi:hypothetical protein
LIEVVCAKAEGWDAAEMCCKALRSLSAVSVQGGPVEKRHLERIYRVRLSRLGAVHGLIGSDRLLSDLASCNDDVLTMVVVESSDGKIYCMLFDVTSTQLVACFVGKDKRSAEFG